MGTKRGGRVGGSPSSRGLSNIGRLSCDRDKWWSKSGIFGHSRREFGGEENVPCAKWDHDACSEDTEQDNGNDALRQGLAGV